MTAFLLFIKPALTFLRGLPWQLWAGLALLALAGLYGHTRYNAGQAEVQTRWDAQEAVYAQQRAAATIAARNTEARHRAEYKAIADRFLAEQDKADADHKTTISGLRAGTLRVRQRFTCPGVSEAPAGAGSADDPGPGGLQPADAEFLVRFAAEADAIARKLNALQAVLAGGRE